MDNFLKVRKYAWGSILIFTVLSLGLVTFGLFSYYSSTITHNLENLSRTVDSTTDFIRYIQRDVIGINNSLINQLREKDLFRNTRSEVDLELIDLSGENPKIFILHGPKRGFYREFVPSEFTQDIHIKNLMAGQSGTDRYTDFNNNDVLISYNYMPTIKAGIIGRIPIWVVKSEIFPMARTVAAISLIFILFSAGLIYFADHQVSRSFKQKDDELVFANKRLGDLNNILNKHFIFCVLNDEFCFVDANARFCEISGFSKNILIDQPFTLLKPMTRNPDEINRLWACLKSYKTWNGILQNTRADGSLFWTDAVFVPLRDRDDRTEYLCILSDITAQQYLESEMLKSKQTVELENQRKNQFILHMSHEIRTPLSSILGYTELLQAASPGDENREKYTNAISRNAQHLKSLIGEILDFSKIESGHLKLELIQLPLINEIKKVLNLFRATEKNVRLSVEYIPPLPEVITTDPLRLRQILVNLIGNAFKFTSEGEIKIRIQLLSSGNGKRRNQLVIAISDTGCGIPEDKQSELFEPFAQVHSVYVKEYPGTGLGLCISRRLARLLGGDLRLIKSSPDRGSTFELTIDAGDCSKTRMLTTFNNTTSNNSNKALELSGIHVLIVEDSIELQALMKTILESKGASVYCASEASEAFDQVNSHPLDLIIMDIQLPKMSGYEIVAEIRRQGHETVPIIAVTAHATTEEKDRVLRSGFNHFLSKPINSSTLIEAVYNWSRSSHVSTQNSNATLPLHSAFDQDINIHPHIPQYIKNLETKIGALSKLIMSKDWERVRNVCHQLKGTSNSFGFPEVSTVAKEIENMSMNPQTMPEELNSHLMQLSQLHHRMSDTYR